MLVDDEKTIVDLFKILLLSRGFKVIAEANNGKEAIDKLHLLENLPDIMILDYRMPIQDGLLTCIYVKNNFPRIKIIFLTADFSIAQKAYTAGADLFLEKPVNFETLYTKIQEIEQRNVLRLNDFSTNASVGT